MAFITKPGGSPNKDIATGLEAGYVLAITRPLIEDGKGEGLVDRRSPTDGFVVFLVDAVGVMRLENLEGCSALCKVIYQ